MSPQTIASNRPAGNGRSSDSTFAHNDLVKPRPRHRGSPIVELDADDLGSLAKLDRLAQPAGTAADVEHSASGLGNQCQHLGPRVTKVSRVVASS